MIFIVCQRVILIYFSAKPEMVARLRGHDRFFCHVQRFSPTEDEVGSLTNKQQQLITALEVIRIEDFTERHVGVGRPPEDIVDRQKIILNCLGKPYWEFYS